MASINHCTVYSVFLYIVSYKRTVVVYTVGVLLLYIATVYSGGRGHTGAYANTFAI